ncbi:MAG: tetratricopeptide repeat protein [Candidatus Nitrotoga sp.]
MKVYLHIGWHKTGSTAIQVFMMRNRSAILKESGILYPVCGHSTIGHHLVAWSLQEPITSTWAKEIKFSETAEVVFARIFQEAESYGVTTLVLSSEEFSATNQYSIVRLARILKGHEVKLIVYLRRQDEYVESLYNQCVKDYGARVGESFEHFLHGQIKANWLDYGSYLDNWVSLFPDLSVDFRVYDRNRFPEKNVVLDFMQAIGLPSSPSYQMGDMEANPSLSTRSVKVLARVNAEVSLDRAEHERVVAILLNAETEESRKQEIFLSPSERLTLLNSFKASNDRMFKRWLDKPNLFQLSKDELEQRKKQWERIDEAEEQRAVDEQFQLIFFELSEYLANLSNSVKENQMTDQYITSVSSDKPAAPDGADELRDAAMVAISQGEWPQALNTLLEAHQRRPDGPLIRLLLAQALLGLGRAEEARPHLDAIPDIPELEPLLSELRARAKDELLVNSAASTKPQDGLISSLKKLFLKKH